MTPRYKDHIYFSVLILVCPPCQDLVKSHLMYAVREEVEVLKEHIKELYERNSMLERENAVLKSLANSEQLSHLTNQLTHGSRSPPLQQQHPLVTNSTPSLVHHEGSQSVPHQPDITSAWFPLYKLSETHVPWTGVCWQRQQLTTTVPLTPNSKWTRLCVQSAPLEDKSTKQHLCLSLRAVSACADVIRPSHCLRHLPSCAKSYSGLMFGCNRAEKGEDGGGKWVGGEGEQGSQCAFKKKKNKQKPATACWCCVGDGGGQRAQRAGFVGQQMGGRQQRVPARDRRGDVDPWKHPAGADLPVSAPNVIAGLEEAKSAERVMERWFGGYVLPERKRTPPAGGSARADRADSLGLLYAASKNLVLFSEPPYVWHES